MDTDGSSISQSNRRLHASGMLLYLLPLFELILGAFFLGMLVSHIQQSDLEEQRHNTDVSCMTYTDRIMADLKSGMAITDSLEQIVISEDGRCDKFYKVAKNLTNPSIESIQLAPAASSATSIRRRAATSPGSISWTRKPRASMPAMRRITTSRAFRARMI